MESTVAESGRHTVVVTVEVPPEEFARDLDRAYRRISQQIRIPGFRKGHVPRRIIDAQIGRDAVMAEFIEDAIPQYYSKAVREHELAPIADPEIDLEKTDEGEPLVFTATVEVRPRLELDGWRETVMAVEPVDPAVTDEDVDQFVDRLRDRFSEVETVGHPAHRGDYVTADIRASVHGAELPELTITDHLYEVGSDSIVEELDEELVNSSAGQILKFNAKLPERFGERAGDEVTFQVLVKEVKAKRLPAADDEFAKMASEFDTLEELRADLREKLADAKAAEARGVFRDRVLTALVDSVDVDLPDRLVDHETEHRVEEATRRAERAGLTLDQVLEAQGWDELRFRSDARAHAVRAIKSDLVLEAVARQEGITVTPEEIARAVADLAQALGREPKEVAKSIERSGQVTALAGDIIRTKALDLLVETAEGTASEAPAEEEPEGTEEPTDPTSSDHGAKE
ncbi:MAG TPA: trigger factor [Actinomycetota bacterium]|nr:trigger factor [Actinomycetota bacterium]